MLFVVNFFYDKGKLQWTQRVCARACVCAYACVAWTKTMQARVDHFLAVIAHT